MVTLEFAGRADLISTALQSRNSLGTGAYRASNVGQCSELSGSTRCATPRLGDATGTQSMEARQGIICANHLASATKITRSWKLRHFVHNLAIIPVIQQLVMSGLEQEDKCGLALRLVVGIAIRGCITVARVKLNYFQADLQDQCGNQQCYAFCLPTPRQHLALNVVRNILESQAAHQLSEGGSRRKLILAALHSKLRHQPSDKNHDERVALGIAQHQLTQTCLIPISTAISDSLKALGEL
mmetsp:Transcript_4075/g.8661  ORF Transcript_4075/g.8661 Transcript_4075/m.8661 type:complete len:241 (+) Transcript_4075:584-1306(+)